MNRKALLLVTFGMAIMLALFIIISVWAYQEYFDRKNIAEADTTKNTTLITNHKDSLIASLDPSAENPKVAMNTLTVMDTFSLEQKIREYNRLKDELSVAAGNKEMPADSLLRKIYYLENSINELKMRNEKVAADNRKLGQIVKQLAGVTPKYKNEKRPLANSSGEDKVNNVLTIGNISLVPVFSSNTTQASISEAEGLLGSFMVRSEISAQKVFNIVVLRPDGNVLRQSGWETGVFNTANGKKVYSSQVYYNGEDERINFLIKSGNLTPGMYTLQIYTDGKMIAQLKKKIC